MHTHITYISEVGYSVFLRDFTQRTYTAEKILLTLKDTCVALYPFLGSKIRRQLGPFRTPTRNLTHDF